jgi:hypothetical protein
MAVKLDAMGRRNADEASRPSGVCRCRDMSLEFGVYVWFISSRQRLDIGIIRVVGVEAAFFKDRAETGTWKKGGGHNEVRAEQYFNRCWGLSSKDRPALGKIKPYLCDVALMAWRSGADQGGGAKACSDVLPIFWHCS